MDLNKEYLEEKKLLEDMRQVYSLLFIAANKLQAEVDASLKELTSKQLMVLTAVAHCKEGEATVMNIATKLGATKQNITRMVKALCQKGILVSEVNEVDKRSVNIRLTDKGCRLLEENVPKGNVYFLNIFQDFSASEISIFRKFLERLSNYNQYHEMFLQEPIKAELKIDYSKMLPIYEALSEKLKEKS